MTYYGPDQVEAVKARTDIVAVFERLLGRETKREGPHHKCCCPYHGERTPSLVLYDDGHWHCYGCGAHGDAVEAVQRAKGLTFQESIEVLAGLAGMVLEDQRPESRPAGEDPRPGLLAAVEFAAAHYEAALWSPAGAAARDYLVGRGFSEQTLRSARVGWCDGRLRETALAAGLTDAVLSAADLVADRQGRPVDRFWQRIAIPVLDGQGRPIAFSCRLLPVDEARLKAEGKAVGKYINSTETPVYKKGDTIYGLHKARSAVRDTKRLILVEGALDVLACQQAGFPEALACLGTAVTDRQVDLLQAATLQGRHPVVLAQDSDAAGQKARLETAKKLLALGVPFRVLTTTEAKDPADLLLGDAAAQGRLAWEKALDAAGPGTTWYLDAIIPNPDSLDTPQKMALLDEIIALVSGLGDTGARHLILDYAAKHLGVDRSAARKRGKAAAAESTTAQVQRIPLTDYGNAMRWFNRCHNDVFYCPEWYCFVLWDGHRWVVDTSQDDALAWQSYRQAIDASLAVEISDAKAAGMADRVGKLRDWRDTCDSVPSTRNAIEHGRRLMAWRASARSFDADPWKVGCLSGTIDLRTGTLLPADRAHRITRCCDAEWLGNISDQRFAALIADMFGTDDIRQYVQRFFGYCMTGITTEKAIVIMQGDTDTGKTTLCNAIKGVLGTYYASVHAENFLQQSLPTKRWELANADHARFVPVEEIGTDGRVFAIDFLKAASGGGDMTGEKKNQQPYTFTPRWKILFLCNDIPSAPAGDNATWRRLHLICCQKAPRQDKSLGDHPGARGGAGRDHEASVGLRLAVAVPGGDLQPRHRRAQG